MLDALYRYATSTGLATEPGFAPKTIRWALGFSVEGGFLGVTELGDVDAKKNSGHPFPGCPEFPSAYMQAGGRAHFLVETAEVVALHLKDPEDEKACQKATTKREFYLGLLEEAAVDVPVLQQVAAALRDPVLRSRAADDLAAHKAKSTELVIVRWGDTYLTQLPGWEDWWRRKRLASAGGEAESDREPTHVCFVTGSPVHPLLTHPKIKRLGTPEPVLLGYDKDAFCSYGLRSSENAAVSEAAAEAYRQGLNHLLEHQRANLAGAAYVHWYSHTVPPEDDFFAQIEAPGDADIDTARKYATTLLQEIRTGERAYLGDLHFYALTLNSAGGRVMVRDWIQGQFPDLVRAAAAWFGDLALTGFTGGTPKPPRLETVVLCLLPELKKGQDRDKWQEAVSGVRGQLWNCALNPNVLIPMRALAMAVEQHRSAVTKQELDEGRSATPDGAADGGLRHVRFHTRLALMKAYHARLARASPERRSYPVSDYLNEEHPHPAYHCGRLLAVYAELQGKAIPGVNAGVVQRFYAAASTTPALVLGRLNRTSNFHLRQLDGGLAYMFEGKLASIWKAIRDTPPTTLNLEQQSLFALGYYHQFAHDRAQQLARSAEKKTRQAAEHTSHLSDSTADSAPEDPANV